MPTTRRVPSPHSPSKTGVNALTIGEGQGGGSIVLLRRCPECGPPPPAPPHKGEGRSGEASELHLRRLLGRSAALAEIEEGVLAEAERSGEQHSRKVLNARVVLLHGVVEEAPRGRELVLDVGELGLQLLEVRVRFEIRIGLR